MILPSSTVLTSDRVETALRNRYAPFPELTMEYLVTALNSFRVGDLRAAARMWEIMLERDGELTANAQKRFEAVGGLEWEIMQVDDSPAAERHAEALRFCYDNLRTTEALDQDNVGDLSALLEQLATAIAHRYSVHELLYHVVNAGKKQATVHATHCPVWFFERRKGRMAYLASEYQIEGTPLKSGEWLVAVGQGHMRPASVAYAVKQFPLRDWLLFASRFGLPGIHGTTTATKGSNEWNEFEEALGKFANDWVTLTSDSNKINLVEAAKTGEAPFRELVERSDRLYAKLFRGSDLATGSQKDAVGATLQTGELAVLTERDARWATSVLNQNLDTPLIGYLFNESPLAWIKLRPRQGDSTERDLKTADFLLRNGAPISVTTARERFNWPEPAPEDPILSAAQISAPPPAPDAAASTAPPLANATTGLVDQAQAGVWRALAADLQPLRERLAGALQITDETTRTAKLRAIRAEFDTLKGDILAQPSVAEDIEQMLAKALAGAFKHPQSI